MPTRGNSSAFGDPCSQTAADEMLCRMGRILKMLVLPTLAVVVGLVAGFALGQRQGLGMGMGFIEAETTGSLTMHVEMASSVRVGDTDRALMLLDTLIDSAAVSLHAQPGTPRSLRSLSQVKTYRSVIPSVGPYATALRDALESVSESAPESQASGLGRLVAQSRR